MNLLTALRQRVHAMIAVARTTAAADETGAVQKLQVLVRGSGSPAELRDPVRSMQLFGIASSPVPGAHHLLLFLEGDRSKGIAVASEDPRYRPKPAQGETILFNAFGMTVAMSSAGIVANPNGRPMTVEGDLRVTGAVIAGYGGSDQVGLQTHTHKQGNDTHGDGQVPTDAPTAGT